MGTRAPSRGSGDAVALEALEGGRRKLVTWVNKLDDYDASEFLLRDNFTAFSI